MIELKKYLQYKLETTKEVNVSTASSWIAEYIEIEKVEKDIEGFKNWEEEDKPIDYVTTQSLDAALRLIGVKIESPVLDKIIDLVELLEDKKGNPTLEEITELEIDYHEQ